MATTKQKLNDRHLYAVVVKSYDGLTLKFYSSPPKTVTTQIYQKVAEGPFVPKPGTENTSLVGGRYLGSVCSAVQKAIKISDLKVGTVYRVKATFQEV